MDFNVNKIKNNNINFEGVKGAINKIDNEKTFSFYAPPYNPNKEDVYLELALIYQKDRSKNPIIDDEINEFKFGENGVIDILQSGFEEVGAPAFAYRYKIVSKADKNKVRYVVDGFKTAKSKDKKIEMNVIEIGKNFGATPKAGTMRHSFIDSDGFVSEGKLVLNQIRTFVRNHFNKLGGTIGGMLKMLTDEDNHELDSYRYVISNPDIGADPVSNHKYWPNNLYQVPSLDDFLNFNTELFKRGKGYVADGALTDQAIQSPLFQHVLKWGEKSPFYHMFKLNGPIALGVLPAVSTEYVNEDNALDHICVHLVNGSYKNKEYDPALPTYIQFYDDRTVSDDLANKEGLITRHDKRPDNHFDIANYQDSVQNYFFEMDLTDPSIEAKLKNTFGGKRAIHLSEIENLEDFLTFEKFKITDNQHVSGASCWDGNVDIIKMNLSNPQKDDPADLKGFFNAREYMVGVASYWTEMVQAKLILETAKAPDGHEEDEAVEEGTFTKRQIALNNDILEDDYDKYIRNLSEDFKYPVIEETKMYDENGEIKRDEDGKPINARPIEYYLKNFKFQTLKTAPNLNPIFATPGFAKDFFSPSVIDNIKPLIERVMNKAIPEEFRDNDEYKAYFLKTYANDIISFIIAVAMDEENTTQEGFINYDNLAKMSVQKFSHEAVDPEAEKNRIIKKISSNISFNNIKYLEDRIQREIQDITLDDFKRADVIVLQGKGGLNWRFDAAKDIGDLDSVRTGKSTFGEIWNGDGVLPGVQDFWCDFIKEIKKYNPSSYIISENTCLNEFYRWNNVEDMKNFDEDLAKRFLKNSIASARELSNKLSGLNKEIVLSMIDVLEKEEVSQEAKDCAAKLSQKLLDEKGPKDGGYEYVKGLEDMLLEGCESGNINTSLSGALGFIAKVYEDNGLKLEYYGGNFENHVDYQKELEFLEQTGSTTSSNYSKYFNNISMFAGVNPEKGGEGLNRAGNLSDLKFCTESFMKYSQPNMVNLSHTFVDNHDKPRVLHCLPLDMALFCCPNIKGNEKYEALAREILNRTDYESVSPKALAVAQKMREVILAQYSAPQDATQKKALLECLRILANGSAKITPGGTIIEGKNDFRRAEEFGVSSYENTITDLFLGAGIHQETKMQEFHKEMLKGSMNLMERLWQVMNALVGTPTLFNGTEFAQTGYESPGKNKYVQNRGQILRGLKDNPLYKGYYNKITAVSALANDANFRALREGSPISLEIVKDEKVNMWPLLKYDERGSRVISVITDHLMPKKEYSKSYNELESKRITVKSIPIKNKDGSAALPDDTVLVRKIYNEREGRYEFDHGSYKVKNGEIYSFDGSDIVIDDTVSYFATQSAKNPRFASAHFGAH